VPKAGLGRPITTTSLTLRSRRLLALRQMKDRAGTDVCQHENAANARQPSALRGPRINLSFIFFERAGEATRGLSWLLNLQSRAQKLSGVSLRRYTQSLRFVLKPLREKRRKADAKSEVPLIGGLLLGARLTFPHYECRTISHEHPRESAPNRYVDQGARRHCRSADLATGVGLGHGSSAAQAVRWKQRCVGQAETLPRNAARSMLSPRPKPISMIAFQRNERSSARRRYRASPDHRSSAPRSRARIRTGRRAVADAQVPDLRFDQDGIPEPDALRVTEASRSRAVGG
jgi:hypothetical protein